LINSIKRAAVAEVEKNGPVKMLFGKVKTVSPFAVEIDQRQVLSEEYFIIGEGAAGYYPDLTIGGEMRRGFRAGDELLLIAAQGGQRLFIADCVKRVDEDTRPTWTATGEVISPAPALEIKVNDYLTLTREQLILTSGAVGLTAGDKVLLIYAGASRKWYAVGLIPDPEN
jgi:hypothetical protein